MHRLFTLSYRRILARLGQQELTPSSAQEALAGSNIAACGEGFLYKLPREEFKHIINIPCPINSLQDSNSELIIASAKRLRQHGKMKEDKICGRCPFKASCPVAKQPFSGQMTNTPLDLLIFWSALDRLNKPEELYFRQWVSAYKLGDSIIAGFDDLASGGKETEEYERLRLEAIKAFEQRPKVEATIPKNQQEKQKKMLEELAQKFNWQETVTGRQQRQSQPSAKQVSKEQQILGRDFSFDEQQEFEPVHKFSKETFTDRKPEKSLKNKKGYQTIQKNQDPSPRNFKKYSNRPEQRQRYSDQEEVPYYQSSQRQRYSNEQARQYNSSQRQPKGTKEEKYSKQPRERQESYGDYRPQKSFKQGKKFVDEYQLDERKKYERSGHKEPTYNHKRVNQYESTPKNQRQNPFVSKWTPEHETYQPERSKQGRYQQRYQQQLEPKQYKQRTPRDQAEARAERQQKAPKAKKQTPRIIEVEQIDEREMSSSRPGRPSRRRGRGQPTTMEQ